jgi:acetyl esterase/lipase
MSSLLTQSDAKYGQCWRIVSSSLRLGKLAPSFPCTLTFMEAASLYVTPKQVQIVDSTEKPMSSSCLPDDEFCHYFANEFNFCVVSIDYRKAPSCPFPFLVEDAAEVGKAVLADDDLPVDHSKVVALGGFSAGGNLSLAIAQMDGLRGRIGTVIPIYPVVDFSGAFKGSFKTTKEGKRDALEKTAHLFDWGYVSAGQDLRDPLLSPIYAKRESLPPRIFIIGAEYDVLCHEAEVMALRLAGHGPFPEVGSGDSWEREGIKWRKVLDVQHAFTHVKKRGRQEAQRKKQCKDLYKEMAGWLRETMAG